MRTVAAIELESWITEQGGVRAAGRVLDVAPATLSRWISGQRKPEAVGERSRAWIEEQTGVAAAGWELLSPPPKAPAARARPAPPPPAVRPRASKTPPSTPAPPPPEDVEEEEAPPATLEALQARARQIPGELRRLRERVQGGRVAMNAAAEIRRLLTDERSSVIAAIDAAGTATVKEIEQLQALLVDITRGCPACKDRVTAALRRLNA